MSAKSAWFLAAVLVGVSLPVEAQVRRADQSDRVQVARAQGIPPGQLPPASQCRVWYDNRPGGRQPSATSCRQAESIAARDRSARVIYGEHAYWTGRETRYGYRNTDPAVPRGSVRDPRRSGGYNDYGRDSRYSVNRPAYQNGYRDGLTKGRDDAEDRDRFDLDRHSWYRSATRGYESRYGRRSDYQAIYREGFEAGYAEGYRVYARR
jgi:hypothetical protein